MRVTGVMFYYYHICHRKLWCFCNQITLENESESVLLGKLLDESSYAGERKHVMIDETVNVDFIRDWKVLHEVKKSKSVEEASIWQVKYYLYFLKNRGIAIEKGILDYPKIRRREEVVLDDGDPEIIERTLGKIEEVAASPQMPPVIHSKLCRSCAYYAYCYI